jgi:DNA-binding NarL/FixJ family response regulator
MLLRGHSSSSKSFSARLAPSLNQLAEHMSKVRILVADDHAGVRELVESMLEPTFKVIGTVGNGKALVETARRLQPDVIITDISMPILSGIEAAKQLQESGSRAKVVFLTVHSDPDIVRACLNVGACGYVVKPRMDSDLLPAVREALAGRIFLSPTDNHEN